MSQTDQNPDPDPDPDGEIDRIELFWRPGCGFCMRLERGLERAGIAMRKQNIWESAEAASEVRRWANGNETVPTVVIGDTGLVNPTATDVFVVLADRAPHLLPADWEPPKPGRIAEAAKRILRG